jgi:hypothetical protein
MADPQIGQGYNSDIAYRYNPGQSAAEFYSQKTGQTFGSPDQLSSYVNANYQGANTNAQNVFDVLTQGFTPRAQALDQIKQDLNTYQQQTFSTPTSTPTRASSSITDSINSEQGNYDSAFKEYNDLKTKLVALSSPNYEQTYNDLNTAQGIPQINTDLANTQKTIRELPYVNRMNMGNAGVTTEGQLNADTQQKGIPLEIQQANLLDRLKLAQDFIDNSLKFKEMDSNASRQSLSDALSTVAQTLDLSRTHLNDLLTQQTAQQERDQLAQQFAYENRISKPFYDIGGTVYRTSDRMPMHSPQEYQAAGGTGDYSDVQKVDISQTFENQLASQKQALDEKNSQFDNNLKLQQLGIQKGELDLKQQQFNVDNGITTDTNISLQGAMDAIGQYESGGNYQAVGKPTASGDKAYGKYQVMGSNISSWTKTALGVSMTPQQFLNNPAAQDKVAAYYMGQAINNYGTLEDVASVWFSGRPAAKAGNAKDVNGTTVPNYIKNIQSIYAKNNPTSSSKPGVSDWVKLLTSGQATIANVPAAIRNDVVKALGGSGQQVVTPTQLQKSKDAVAAFNSATNLLATIESLSKNVVTAQSPAGALFQRITSSIGAATKLSPQAALYKDTVSAFTSQLARAAGEKGVLTDQDVNRIKQALPQLGDTADIASAKLDTLKNLFAGLRKGLTNAYTSQTPTNGGQSSDPLGLFP